MPAEIRVLPTADLGRDGLRRLRALLDTAFDDFDDDSWDHSLGGLHVVAGPPDAPVGHAAVVGRRLLHGGTALRAGYVEAVAVHPDVQGRGIGAQLMTAVGRLVRGGYRLGALGASDPAARLYRRLGWTAWTGPLSALTPDGVVETPEERGGVYVLPVDVVLDPARALTCDWRDGELW
ncbi:aminoglycoside 2'-N-acetyltransferase Aac [Pseudonocardia sp. Ae168_Ps1]|uniref:GNAT family N-acetyltransferase n=1 Tax=unclassified Pseudonocardia TaxID=2619320 RepID=UPI00094ADECC|nr:MULTISPECIES: GNAT family N-acetyltransferase [unclassified Pseudonocardia]OLL71043.1 aminoglycoside 2'-N-acetyltransferase Aac [Pseudonocardia sp. Ae168_Ps1]OLL77407.1 aminoglycoside 2'-N-acetyltransferase Aac [Pseudonocardia sp. Ae150A_Ps1]OLL88481.1 aminoglycoside 2'-N-acetyltransferase Aac [Pseudonocardia sp. Ae263_Ps1]OLL91496.1 aminoglycoside 2'-N-acetyltransferase Aac [Pseudonocardia sp. Ae356_Ps1]